MSSILFLNRVYPPAEAATGQLLAELAGELVRRGYEVTVVTGRAGLRREKGEGRGERGEVRSEKCEVTALPSHLSTHTSCAAGVRIETVGGLPFTRASHLRRAVSYLSLYPAMLWRALRLPRHDVVVTLTDPPLQLLLGPVLQWCKGSKTVHWAQDIYPELAEEMGVLRKDGLIARVLRRLSTWALRRSDSVVAVGQCMKKRLMQRGLAPQSIAVVQNWGHTASAECGTRNEESIRFNSELETRNPKPETPELFRDEHGLAGKFVVMYSGNLGLAHPFEAILDAAERLQPALPHVVFLFVGAGPRLPWVREQVGRRHLENVRFLPFQPKERLAESLAAADLHLASMRHELCGLVVPSKVYGVMAAGRPCVFLGPEESEAAQFILQHGCGSVLPHASGARLAATVSHWATHPDQLREARQRVEAVADQAALPAAVEAFDRILRRVLELDAPMRQLQSDVPFRADASRIS